MWLGPPHGGQSTHDAERAGRSILTDVLDVFFGVASILIGIGLVMAGASVVRARTWTGWHRFMPLACGAAVFVIVIPGIFGPFIAGRLAIGIWMLMFAGLGLALLDEDPGRCAERA